MPSHRGLRRSRSRGCAGGSRNRCPELRFHRLRGSSRRQDRSCQAKHRCEALPRPAKSQTPCCPRAGLQAASRRHRSSRREDLAAGRLVRLLRAFEPPPLPVHLVAASHAHMPPKIRAFLDLAAEQFAALPVIH
ncbi:MAG: hypothetical protein KGL45_07505 [Gammaproteobacteria bacterium]|nr:hypothetical protein [Gammaproteobacteria bacterium]